jgi:ankyrin repeat protein
MPRTRKIRGGGSAELFTAVLEDNLDSVKQELASGTDVNSRRPDGEWTPLMMASFHGYSDIVRELLARGADVTITDDDGITALFSAVQRGHLDVVKQLTSHGASPNVMSQETGITPLMAASDDGTLEIVKDLLDHGADINARSTGAGWTPLVWAVSSSHLEVVRELMKRGADTSITGYYGDTVFDIANQVGPDAEIMRILTGQPEEPIESRNIPAGSENAISFDEIKEGNAMVNFPRQANTTEYSFGSFYKDEPQIRSLTKNPQTRYPLRRQNFKRYTAHIVSKGGKTRKRSKRSRRSRRAN